MSPENLDFCQKGMGSHRFLYRKMAQQSHRSYCLQDIRAAKNRCTSVTQENDDASLSILKSHSVL